MPKEPIKVDEEHQKEIQKARRELRALIFKKNCAPLMLRLAWQDAATYNEESDTGGPNGSIRLKQELSYEANKGLQTAVQYCEEVKTKFKKVSYADLYQLAGVVAVEITGGPSIDFIPGREDTNDPDEDRLLPDPNQGAPHLRNIFNRMGLGQINDQDIVVLCGGHTLGKAHKENSYFEGQWTKDELKFDNSYFVELLKGKSFRLPIEEALLEDKKFRRYVENYAKDEENFFKDYAASHKKFSELGWNFNKDHKEQYNIPFSNIFQPKKDNEGAKKPKEDSNKKEVSQNEVSDKKEVSNGSEKVSEVANNQEKRSKSKKSFIGLLLPSKKLIFIASAMIVGYLRKRKIQVKK